MNKGGELLFLRFAGQHKEEEQREGERPDYLVEDEETWTPQRDVAPRVIKE